VKQSDTIACINRALSDFGTNVRCNGSGVNKHGERLFYVYDVPESVLLPVLVDYMTTKINDAGGEVTVKYDEAKRTMVLVTPHKRGPIAPPDLQAKIDALLADGSWFDHCHSLPTSQKAKKHMPKLYTPGEQVQVGRNGLKTRRRYYYVTNYRAFGGGMVLLMRDDGGLVNYAQVWKIED
jgi:hypothetical protein